MNTNFQNFNKSLVLSLAAASLIALCACTPSPGTAAPPDPTAAPTPEPTPEPTPGIVLGTVAWWGDETELDLTGSGVTAAELSGSIAAFPSLERVTISDCAFSSDEKLDLMAQFPEISFTWPVEVCGMTLSSDDTIISLRGTNPDFAELISCAKLLPNLAVIDLTDRTLDIPDVISLREAFPSTDVLCTIEAFDMEIATNTELLDLTEDHVSSLQEVEDVIRAMSGLERIILPPLCGFADEDIDALNQKYDVRIVWTVRFNSYVLRTDTTYFCAADLPSNGYIAPRMSNADFEPLKYCVDLEALDLGHMNYNDLSFLSNMTKLKYLVLVEARYNDISVIGTLHELKYLEIFNNRIADMTPLANCENLRHLNIGYCSTFDYHDLKLLTQLERLWYPGNRLTDEERQEIADALPNTQCYLIAGDGDGSTGGGWREADVYYEMRQAFNMFYQPGGTI